MANFVVLSLAVALVAIFAVRLIPSPERTVHNHGEYFGVTHDTDNQEAMRIESADKEKIVIIEKQGSKCEPDNFDHICSPPYHYHTFQYEDFEVLEGSMKIKLDGEFITLHKGDKVTVPPKAKHTYSKHGTDDMMARVTLRPNPDGLGQRFFPNLFGSVRDSNGNPSPFQIIYLFCNHGVRLADVPVPLHEVMCWTTNILAPMMGYKLEYQEYPYQ
jgi:mannose-6-phosphate isomerase-like protein (cupin superfamily)